MVDLLLPIATFALVFVTSIVLAAARRESRRRRETDEALAALATGRPVPAPRPAPAGCEAAMAAREGGGR